MVGPRCFCAHGLRVEKGVQSVTVGPSAAWQLTGSAAAAAAGAEMRHSAGKNKAKEKHEAWAVCSL